MAAGAAVVALEDVALGVTQGRPHRLSGVARRKDGRQVRVDRRLLQINCHDRHTGWVRDGAGTPTCLPSAFPRGERIVLTCADDVPEGARAGAETPPVRPWAHERDAGGELRRARKSVELPRMSRFVSWLSVISVVACGTRSPRVEGGEAMRRLSRAFGALAVLVGGLSAGSAVAPPDTANAVACGSAIAAGTSCTLTGTATLSAGTLTLTSPSSLAWATTLNGLNQSVVDTTAADQQYTVDDATGSGAGWHVTTSATTFTSGSHTLPDAGTFSTNGSTSSVSAGTAPSATCTGTCTLPSNSTTYPVAVTTAASSPTPVTVYDTAAGTGLGQVVIGGSTAASPIGWWINIPAGAAAGTYTSTITMEVISGP
ncbi:hypothetical protein DN069_09735 [Streptacidiphilus pinicola]|uniref:Uncharacterized protein n=1 Tax=Streptacidiphilus pinicola TaxID=2219663 RepID=A0A2X0KF87_9ACTN|nr:hypothetical protein DN069_09735 [Streptacidiphilus pinicola]